MAAGASVSASRTIDSVWETIGAAVSWDELPVWPPDVFALTDLLLVQADTYRFVSSPPAGAIWPPHDRWTGSVRMAGTEWSEAARLGTGPGPGLALDQWEILSKALDLPLDVLSRGEPWNVCEAIITLHALADEACSSLNSLGGNGSAFAERAWAMLESQGSLSRFPPSQVRVLPKTHLPAGGITLRSLSRYLSAHTLPVEVKWRRGMFPALSPDASSERSRRILLLPWWTRTTSVPSEPLS